ncbi:MAG: arginine--tRNA ligase [Planctomycetota bacterium]
MRRFTAQIAAALAARVDVAVEELLPAFGAPPKPEMGDLSLPCFPLAKKWGKAPPAIAAELAALDLEIPWLASVEALGPYLNFRFDPGAFAAEVLADVAAAGAAYGSSDGGEGKAIVIDYSSPNIAKHLAVHHLRSTMIGNALVRLGRACGYTVIGVNHLGDWGTSFGQLATGWDRYGSEYGLDTTPLAEHEDPIGVLNKVYTRFHDEASDNAELADAARDWFRRLEEGDVEARTRWQQIRDASWARFEQVYSRLGVEFDEVIGESFFEDHISGVVDELGAKGLLEESDEAQVVRMADPNLPPMLIRKKDGSTLYGTRDLAAAQYRWDRWHFERCLYVVDAGQGLHFRQLFEVLDKMGKEYAGRMEHVDFGVMRLAVDGKWVKGRTRHGKVVLLEEVLDAATEGALQALKERGAQIEDPEAVAQAVGVGAVVFADLKAKRIKDVNFDLEQMTSFEGETGPYLQYTHVRFHGLARKYQGSGGGSGELLVQPEELALLKEIASFESVLIRATAEAEPSLLSNYLLGLASAFNTYFASGHKILAEDATLAADRMQLVDALRIVLGRGLSILGITPLERM